MKHSAYNVSLTVVAALGGLVLVLHVALVNTFRFERLWWDGAHQLYRAILADGFYIPQDRYIHLLTQSVPALLMPFTELSTVVQGYSLSLALPFMGAVVATVVLRDLRGLLLSASLICCLSTFTFFWAISEIRISIGLSVILLTLLRRVRKQYWGTAILFLALPVYFAAHPISLIVYGWIGVYHILFNLDKTCDPFGLATPQARQRRRLLFLFCLWSSAALLLRYAILNPREMGILEGVNSYDPWWFFPAVLLIYGWLQMVVIIAAIGYMFTRPERWLAAFAATSSLGWILLVFIVVPVGGPYYIEHLLQPAVFFALAPTCYLLPEKIIAPNTSPAPVNALRVFVVTLLTLTIIGYGRMILLGNELSSARAEIRELTGHAIKQDIRRAHISKALAQEIIGPNFKYLPVYSLLYTSSELNRSTVFWPRDAALPDWVYRDPDDGGDAAARFFSLPQTVDWQPLSLPSAD
jgi:hypothetical protein